MQTQNRLLDDLARVANGAIGTLSGVKGEIEAIVRQRLETVLANMDLVTRDEFDAVKAMAAKAREEQEVLTARVAELETALAARAKPAAKKKAAPRRKPAAKG
ncbi:MAG: accessory factor UbiK family protein [Alphaproteobacteria bacterium]|nr:accessory factor UbiK family protein [Alphaproteobacteria bacterium]